MGQTNTEDRWTMKIFHLTIPNSVNNSFFDDRGSVAIDISTWCKSHGLVRDVDFDWSFMPKTRQLYFRVWGEKNDAFTTMFALRWGEYL